MSTPDTSGTIEVIIISDAVYTGCCAARQISDRKLLPSSIYLNLNYLKWLVAKWWICALHLTHSNAHTHTAVHTHTHTVNTHPEQWAANAAAPGEQLGVRSRVSPQSWYWRWREHLLFTPPHWQFLPARDSNPQPRVTSPMLHPFGHDCVYDVLTQISNDFQWSLYRVQCRHGVTHLSRRTKATSVYDRRPSAPWVLSSTGKLIRYLHGSYFLPYRSADVFLLFFYPPSLSFCHSARLFTKRSLLHIMSRHAPYCWLATSLFWYSPWLFVKLHTLPSNWSKVTVKTFITFQNIIFQVNAVLLKILFIKESW